MRGKWAYRLLIDPWYPPLFLLNKLLMEDLKVYCWAAKGGET